MQTIVTTVEAGALVRRQVRVYLDVRGIPWTEHKGWLSSTFVMTVTEPQWEHLRKSLEEWNMPLLEEKD